MNRSCFFLGILFFMAVSCSKEETTPKLEELNVLQFTDFKEFITTRSIYTGSSPVNARGVSVGFKSWGVIADQIYAEMISQIESGGIGSRYELLNYVSEHNKFLLRTIDENGDSSIETIFDDDYKYIMNVDRVFKMGDDFYKVYTNGIKRLDRLDNLSETEDEFFYSNVNDPSFFERDIVSVTGHLREDRVTEGIGDSNNECQFQKSGQTTNGNNRTKVYANAYREKGTYNQYAIWAKWRARPLHSVFGEWFYVSRTIKGSYAIAMDYQDNTGWRYLSGSDYLYPYKTDHAQLLVNEPYVFTWSLGGEPEYHLSSVYIWADTSDTGYADKQCNENWVCLYEYCYPPQG